MRVFSKLSKIALAATLSLSMLLSGFPAQANAEIELREYEGYTGETAVTNIANLMLQTARDGSIDVAANPYYLLVETAAGGYYDLFFFSTAVVEVLSDRLAATNCATQKISYYPAGAGSAMEKAREGSVVIGLGQTIVAGNLTPPAGVFDWQASVQFTNLDEPLASMTDEYWAYAPVPLSGASGVQMALTPNVIQDLGLSGRVELPASFALTVNDEKTAMEAKGAIVALGFMESMAQTVTVTAPETVTISDDDTGNEYTATILFGGNDHAATWNALQMQEQQNESADHSEEIVVQLGKNQLEFLGEFMGTAAFTIEVGTLPEIEASRAANPYRNSAGEECYMYNTDAMNTATVITIPDYMLNGIGNVAYVSSVADEFFPYGSYTVTTVYFPDAITNIGRSAFEGCERLNNVELPKDLVTIEADAFMSCYALTSIDFSRATNLTTIESGAFSGTHLAGDLRLPATMTTIGANAFFGCNDLVVYVPSTITSVAENAFGEHMTVYYDGALDTSAWGCTVLPTP